jgi:hypothetical protein
VSDLDEKVEDAAIVDAGTCWTTCLAAYPDTLKAIDYYEEDGVAIGCYCQDDCRCMDMDEDGDVV